ncbi:hypothetical protein SUGI_0663180 [Cryptomeria japonica]|nr:hypothetical protein SUGI_0663180 [Cryptomeria japonica]
METYICSLGFDVWMSIKSGYIVPSVPPTDPDAKEYENNAKEKHAILRDAKVKEAKLQALRSQLEGIKMKDEEKIADYLHRFDETVNAIRGLGEEIADEILVKKVLRSLAPKYDTKVSVI